MKNLETTENAELVHCHEQAAQHYAVAAVHHREAANAFLNRDSDSAAHHAQVARGHAAHAADHDIQASKQYALENTGLSEIFGQRQGM